MNEDRCGRCGASTRPSLFRGVPMRTCPGCDTITVGRADLSTLLGSTIDGSTPAGRSVEATAVSVPADLRSEPKLELPRSSTPTGPRAFAPVRVSAASGSRDLNPYTPGGRGTPGRPQRMPIVHDDMPRLDTDEVPTVFGGTPGSSGVAAPLPAPMPQSTWPEPEFQPRAQGSSWYIWMGIAGLVVAAAFLTTAWTVANWSRPQLPSAPVPIAPAPLAPDSISPDPSSAPPISPAPISPPPISPPGTIAPPTPPVEAVTSAPSAVPAPPDPVVAVAPPPARPAAPSPSKPSRPRNNGSISAMIGEGWSQVETAPARAADAFGRALETRPGDPEASYGMGYALLRLGQTDRAVGHLCRALGGSAEVRREVSALLARNNLKCD
jgi:hypothetical protein